ncbi:MAG: hypothetical protein EWM73_03117 [Nitrospira sp.]|nr:MAG: hypothetical protein EWM73_03117 [Nitrospira sp.]
MCAGIIIMWTDLHRSRAMRGWQLSVYSLGPNRAECNRVKSTFRHRVAASDGLS